MTKKKQETLFDRLGGMPAVEAAVDLFYKKVLADSNLKRFFDDTDIVKQRAKQKSFLAFAFGGPVKYDGKDMRNAHAKLYEKGLNEEHFGMVAGHLVATLQELGISQDLIDEVVTIALSVKDDVLGVGDNPNMNNKEEDMALGKNLKGDSPKKSTDSVTSDLYKDLLMKAADAVITIDETKSVIFWNTAAEKIWGYSASETMGKNIKNFVPDEHKAPHDGYVDNNLTSGINKIVGTGREVEVQTKSGGRTPIMLTMSKYEEGNKTYFMAICKDISAQKKMESEAQQASEELQAQEEELRQNMEELQATQEAVEAEKLVIEQTLEQAIDSIITINAEKEIIFYNKAAEQMFGYSREEVMGQNVKMIVPMEHRAPHDSYVNANMTTGVNKVVGSSRDLEATRKDGSRFWVQLSLSKVSVEGSVQFTAFIKDITAQVEKEKEIEEQQRLIEAQLDILNNSCLVSETDLKGVITYVNDKFCEVAQYRREELIGQPHNIVRHPDMPKEVFKEMWATIGKGNLFNGTVKNRKKDGTPYYVDAYIRPILDANGKPEKYIGVRYDISEAVATQETVKLEAEKMNATLDQAIDAVVSINGETKEVLFFNKAAENLWGYRREEVLGKNVREIVPMEHQAPHDGYVNANMNTGVNKVVGSGRDVELQRKDGSRVWVNLQLSKVETDGDIQYTAFIKDIHTEKSNQLAFEKITEYINELAVGNLTAEMDVDGIAYDDSVEKVINDLVALKTNLSTIMGDINEVSILLASSSEELLTKSDQMQATTQEVASAIQQMAEGAHQQAQQTDEASKLVEEVLRTSNEVSGKADLINKAAEVGQTSSKEGLSTVQKVVENMEEIESSAKLTSESIDVLTERSEEIARTLNVITDIAAQTNLLALNAAIEAARAGEAGRGFAVVAEEIRKLAEDSRKSAVDIQKVVTAVQKDVTQAGKAIETMGASVKSGNQASKEAEEVFGTIGQSTNETFEFSQEIQSATGEQKESINETVKNIEKIVVVSEETAAGAEQIATSSKDLSQGMDEVNSTSKQLATAANQLNEGVSKFKLK